MLNDVGFHAHRIQEGDVSLTLLDLSCKIL